MSGVDLKKMSEPSFFFCLSKYQQKVIDHIEANPEFLEPAQYRGEILERLKSIEVGQLLLERLAEPVALLDDPTELGKPDEARVT
eukprot:g4116.t1